MTKEIPAQAAMGLPKDYDEAVRQRDAWYDTAARFCDDVSYYRRLVVEIGEMIGQPARIQDDGNDCGEVLCAKVPEVVEKVVAALRETIDAYENALISSGVPCREAMERNAAARATLGLFLSQESPT